MAKLKAYEKTGEKAGEKAGEKTDAKADAKTNKVIARSYNSWVGIHRACVRLSVMAPRDRQRQLHAGMTRGTLSLELIPETTRLIFESLSKITVLNLQKNMGKGHDVNSDIPTG